MGYRLKKTIRASELAMELNLELLGRDVSISEVATLRAVSSGSLTFSTGTLDVGELSDCVIIMPSGSEGAKQYMAHLVSDNPRLDFIRALDFLMHNIGFAIYLEEPVVHPTVRIGRNVVIENGCVVGEGAVIEHNVVLHAGTRVGINTRIRSCASIGGDGFGFERLADGTPLRFPHLGGVLIGSNVEIGALNSIARGTLGDTVISDFVKTDNLVHIAHNCHVGKGVFITACAELSGGVRIGENSWIGPNSSFMQKTEVGDNALIGLGAVVTKNVPSFAVYAGNPARKIRDVL